MLYICYCVFWSSYCSNLTNDIDSFISRFYKCRKQIEINIHQKLAKFCMLRFVLQSNCWLNRMSHPLSSKFFYNHPREATSEYLYIQFATIFFNISIEVFFILEKQCSDKKYASKCVLKTSVLKNSRPWQLCSKLNTSGRCTHSHPLPKIVWITLKDKNPESWK